MAKAKKKTTRKTGLLNKLKTLLPRKKATPGRAIKDALKNKKSTRLAMTAKEDPAHAPGHRKLPVDAATNSKITGAQTKIPGDIRVSRTESNQRRIITGAALGKSGRMV